LVDGETLDRSPRWQVVIGDATTALAAVQFAVDGIPVEIDGGPILRSCEPITKANYDFMVAHQAWAADHAPDHPKASPRRAVDFHAIRPPF
jgi:hypothetical protein